MGLVGKIPLRVYDITGPDYIDFLDTYFSVPETPVGRSIYITFRWESDTAITAFILYIEGSIQILH